MIKEIFIIILFLINLANSAIFYYLNKRNKKIIYSIITFLNFYSIVFFLLFFLKIDSIFVYIFYIFGFLLYIIKYLLSIKNTYVKYLFLLADIYLIFNKFVNYYLKYEFREFWMSEYLIILFLVVITTIFSFFYSILIWLNKKINNKN